MSPHPNGIIIHVIVGFFGLQVMNLMLRWVKVKLLIRTTCFVLPHATQAMLLTNTRPLKSQTSSKVINDRTFVKV